MSPYPPNPHCALTILIVGAGLGGLAASISLSLSGHTVTLLESASTISEIGAGIQILPNASRLLQSWGLGSRLLPFATFPKCVNLRRWADGRLLSSLAFQSAGEQWGSPFWDFHRADLQREMLGRAEELGATVQCGARVVGVEDGGTVVLADGERVSGDLVIGADGIFSTTRACLPDGGDIKPTPTGDLAYRLLLNTDAMLADPELREFVEDPQVNYWLGPGRHAVNYVLKGGEKFNMVLLVPDDIPDDGGATTVAGDVVEMRAHYEGWDPRIGKLLLLCESVQKWKLCIRDAEELESWSSEDGTFVLLGDSVHATLPYLASGAGMALEDGAAIGEILARVKGREELKFAMRVYERCRKERTKKVVERGNLQQYIYHIEDGEEQRERDRLMAMEDPPAGEALVWRDKEFAKWLFGGSIKADVEKAWKEEVENQAKEGSRL